ncbi:MAG: hypothetical protein C4294_20150 [Nitrospiraceae bacterium]
MARRISQILKWVIAELIWAGNFGAGALQIYPDYLEHGWELDHEKEEIPGAICMAFANYHYNLFNIGSNQAPAG